MTTVFDPIPPDTRSIDEMPFGSGAEDQQGAAKTVRDMLRKCGVSIAHEIEELGCTGASAKGLMITEIYALRMGLAGGGVGLTCFVPPTRYCLAHSTIGGLQVGQASRFTEEIEKISRDLSPRERGQIELTEAARRVRGGDMSERLMKTADALGGRDLPLGVELESDAEDDDDGEELSDIVARNREISHGWTCPEHRTPLWQCRYCVAQTIVEGPLEPTFVVQSLTVRAPGEPLNPGGNGVFTRPSAGELASALEKFDGEGVNDVIVYVRAATFSRKLARD